MALVVAQNSRHQTGHGVDDDHGRHFPASQDIIADRNLVRLEVSAARVRQTLRNVHTTRSVARGRPVPRPPIVSSLRPCGVSITRCPGSLAIARTASTHSTTGSTFSTMPGPPPKGRSSTVWCLSWAQSRMSCSWTSIEPALDGQLQQALTQVAREHAREQGQHIEPHRILARLFVRSAGRLFLRLASVAISGRLRQALRPRRPGLRRSGPAVRRPAGRRRAPRAALPTALARRAAL